MSKADERHDITVAQYIDSIEDESLQSDTNTLLSLMQRISNEQPVLYGYGTIGFGVYKYEYASGRKGDAHTLAFYPRKGKFTVYLMDGTKRYVGQLTKLGKHTTTGYCLYIKRLEDIQLRVLEEILRESYAHITKLAQSGPIESILWQS